MKEIPNDIFPKECTNSIVRSDGLVVARTFSPREYTNKKGENKHALLPEIIICKASKDAPIEINTMGIIAKSPSPAYALQFNPMWGEEYEKGKEIIYKFGNAFIPEEEDEIGNIAVIKHNLTGIYDNKAISGKIICSGVENRDITLRGKMDELENMIIVASSYIPKKDSDLRNDIHYDKSMKKYYNINISNEDVEKFAKSIACKIF
jgi:hypothetical protein